MPSSRLDPPSDRALPVLPRVRTGLDRFARDEGRIARGESVCLLGHPASVDARLNHLIEIVRARGLEIASLLGPEHGFDGMAQDMETVDGHAHGPVPVYSLYGADVASLSPKPEMFHGASWLICDLQDVGARYYTFVWTVVLAAEVALRAGLQVLILDRPNPLGGTARDVEGGGVEPGYESFVGLHDVPTRHGLTLGELVRMAVTERGRVATEGLRIERVTGWRRGMRFRETGLPWVLPSPNMPSFETAVVYPGQCLFEGTNLSEGRGTTRPFEIFGAPWVDAVALAATLRPDDVPGLGVRPFSFKPTFHKHAHQACAGLHLHVLDPAAVRSVRTSWALLAGVWRQGTGRSDWRREPYEFVSDRLAIDLLAGGPWLREAVEDGRAVSEIERSVEDARLSFLRRRERFLLYDDA